MATGNTEYLCDAANYLMFEFMYPQKEGAYFRTTDSGESAGVAGTPVAELGRDKHFESITNVETGGNYELCNKYKSIPLRYGISRWIHGLHK